MRGQRSKITYIQKEGLREALREQLYSTREVFKDGVGEWYVDGDEAKATEVTNFIANYNDRPKIKERRLTELRELALEKLNAIYGGDAVFTEPEQVRFFLDIDASYRPQTTQAPRLLEVKDTIQAFVTKRNEIRALTSRADLLNYDITTGWPS